MGCGAAGQTRRRSAITRPPGGAISDWHTKTVLRLAFGLAVRHEVVPRNPIDGVARLHRPKRTPTALTAAEVNAIRAVIKVWSTPVARAART